MMIQRNGENFLLRTAAEDGCGNNDSARDGAYLFRPLLGPSATLFPPCLRRADEGGVALEYHCRGMKTLKEALSDNRSADEKLLLLSQLLSLRQRLEDYFIDESTILWDSQAVFLDEGEAFKLIYFPSVLKEELYAAADASPTLTEFWKLLSAEMLNEVIIGGCDDGDTLLFVMFWAQEAAKCKEAEDGLFALKLRWDAYRAKPDAKTDESGAGKTARRVRAHFGRS